MVLGMGLGRAKDFRWRHRFDGNRWNDLHYSREFKMAARRRKGARMSAPAGGTSEQPVSLLELVKATIVEAIDRPKQPSEWELVQLVEERCGVKARWLIRQALEELTGRGPAGAVPPAADDPAHSRVHHALLDSEDSILRCAERPRLERPSSPQSTLSSLGARRYRGSKAFSEMLDFMANFRDYAPFNNMLVRLQDPTCSFFATAADWKRRFDRQLKDDARPMLILAPKHPVMVVVRARCD